MKIRSESDSYGILDVAKDLISGNLEVADSVTISNRRDTCNACVARSPLDICTACGCVLAAKIRLKHSSCPMDNWNA